MRLKKNNIFLWLVFLSALTVVFQTSCSDDPDKGDFVPMDRFWEIYDKEFVMFVDYINRNEPFGDELFDGSWEIVLSHQDNEYSGAIDAVLKLNDELIEWDFNDNGSCSVEFDESFFEFGSVHKFELDLMGNKKIGNLRLMHPIILNTNPNTTFQPSKKFTLSWLLKKDPMTQFIISFLDDEGSDESEVTHTALYTSQRSYTLPANSIPEDFESFGLGVITFNFVEFENLAFLSGDVNIMWFGGDSEIDTRKIKNLRSADILKQLRKSRGKGIIS